MYLDSDKWYTPPISWNVPKNNLNYVGTLNEIMYFLSLDIFSVLMEIFLRIFLIALMNMQIFDF